MTTLASCTGPGDSDASADLPANGDSTTETDLPDVFGPHNQWPHALVEDVPTGLEGTGIRTGDIMENLTLTDQFGDPVELHQFYGQVVVLDVFAQWCVPCQEAAPHGQALWLQLQDEGVMYVAVMVEANTPPVDTDDLEAWAGEFDLTHPVLADPWAEHADLAPLGFPTFLLIDQQMRIANHNVRPDFSAITEADVRPLLESD